ncbi:hypothetical protein DB346_08400 [Verrucomicrobia bacterium LW23]|nr:hypothetical protein DB346_08400 [Verrucomicrobia bacterium LW23]
MACFGVPDGLSPIPRAFMLIPYSRCKGAVLLQKQVLAALLVTAMVMVPPGHVGMLTLQANPSGGTVAGGSATITSGPGNVTVRQSRDRAVVNWNNFSIRQGETTTFVQPGSRSAVLNRVTGAGHSQLDGNLRANGQVYLVNPNGVVIGKTGRINTAGFTASTHDVTNAEFMKGGDMTFRGNSSASVINHGKIRATDGDVTLIARQVENHGKIRAKNGSVNLAGGSEVLVRPSGTEGQRVFIKSGTGSVVNTGSIRAAAAELRAAGGNEYALAVNNSGVIRATAVDRSGGRIVLKAESTGGSSRNAGRVVNSGRLIASARAPGRAGGRVEVTGDHVTLTSTSRIEAKGYGAKGGTVLVGGGYQGKDTEVYNASTVTVEKGSEINVDGGTKGGTSILWSNDRTIFDGHISAKGPGFSQETGGFVEVSSKGVLEYRGIADTAGGTVLLDPATLEIIVGGGTDVNASTLDPSHILAQLALGNFTLMATDGIIVSSSFALTASTMLTLQTTSPTGYINFNAPVSLGSAGADLHLITTTLNFNAPITVNAGSVITGTATTANVANTGLAASTGKIQNAIDALAVGGTINLASGTYREANITIGKSLTIRGNGYGNTIVTSDTDGNLTGESVGLRVTPGAGNAVSLNSFAVDRGYGSGGGVLIVNGNVSMDRMLVSNSGTPSTGAGTDRGGGIRVMAGTLTMSNSIVRNNKTAGFGGGIAFDSGTSGTITDSLIQDNVALNTAGNATTRGGGIFFLGAAGTFLNITGTTFRHNVSRNSATAATDTGGGISIDGGTASATVRINSSLFIDNESEFGGAIYASGSNTKVYVINSTLTGNKATGSANSAGGGIRSSGLHTLWVSSSTIVFNEADTNGGGIAHGGSTARVYNSVISLNKQGGSLTVANSSTEGSNMSGTFASNSFNAVSVDADTLKLAPLDYYGGKVMTYGLLPGSSLINAGGNAYDDTEVGTLAFDGRGRTRTVGGRVDIGAFESQTAADYVVTTTADYNPASGFYVDYSLRAALNIRNAGLAESNGNISFNISSADPGYNSTTGRWVITAAPGTTGFAISAPVSINGISQTGGGAGLPPKIEVNGADLGSVFTITNNANVTLAGLYITNGTATQGGGINAVGTGVLTITDSVITGNSAGNGGGIYLSGGTLNLTGSVVSNNTATTGSGGGLAVVSGTSILQRSTIHNNTALGSGGGIYLMGGGLHTGNSLTFAYNTATSGNGGAIAVMGNATYQNSTIAFNSAGSEGGGLYVGSGVFSIYNSILARNTAASGTDGSNASGATFTDAGFNLIGVSDGITSPLAGTTLSGSSASPLDPLLTTTLANYGGSTPTLALLPGSPAIGAGDPALTGGSDQRGVIRDAAPDIGAYESLGFTYTVTSGNNQATRPNAAFGSNVVITVAANDALLTDLTGGKVTLTPPSSGASLTGTPGLTSTISGTTATFALTANGTSGSYTVGIVDSANTLSMTNQYVLTITPDSGQGIVYGDTDAGNYTYSYSGLASGDSILAVLNGGSLDRLAGLNAGTYAINQGTLDLAALYADKYALDFTTGVNYTITTRNITITADGKTITYGDADVPLTYTAGTLYNGDTFTGTLSRDAGSDAGTYGITQGTLSIITGNAANYNVTYVGASYTINKRAVLVTADSGLGKTYGGTDGALTYTTDAGAVAFAGALQRDAGENAGTYAYDVSSLTANNSNYSFTLAAGPVYTIHRALLTVTATDASGTVGEPFPTLGGTITGFQFTDDASVVSGLVYGTTATAASPAGAYDIMGSGATALNYTFAYVNGTLTLTDASVTPGGSTPPPVTPTVPPTTPGVPTAPSVPGTGGSVADSGNGTQPGGNTAQGRGTITIRPFALSAFDATWGRNNEDERHFRASGPGLSSGKYRITYEGRNNSNGALLHLSSGQVAP